MITKSGLKRYLNGLLDKKQTDDFMDEFIENVDNPKLDELLIDEFFVHKRISLVKHISIAASILLMIAFALHYTTFSTSNVDDRNELVVVTTTTGVTRTVVLPDSSEVLLQPESKLVYEKAMKGGTRSVTLEGEAYLQVAKDPSRMFVLHCETADVKVYGTSFNVSSYAEDDNFTVTLYDGKVVTESHYKNKTTATGMKPGEHLILNKQSGNVKLLNIPSIQQTDGTFQWKNNILFVDEPLCNILRKLERRYDVTISMEDSTAKNTKLYAVFVNDESLIDMLKTFSAASNTSFRIRE
ncbi:MAG: FecR family protein [Prevotella sp.]|nr:FecR family protein [Candidatus Equicola stercoris]